MAKQPRSCECGCGEMTKGGRFRPGHDARMHGKIKNGIAHHLMPSIEPAGPQPVPEFVDGLTNADGVRAGYRVRTKNNVGRVVEGTVFRMTRFGWFALITDDGRQHVGYQGDLLEIVNDDPKAVAKATTPTVRAALARIGV